MTDSFKDQLGKIAAEAQDRAKRDQEKRAAREKEFRQDCDDAFEAADSFNNRVIVPVLAEFSAGAPGASDFECEFNESDSQPEFIHSCKMQKHRLTVSLLYWTAGSAQLRCGLGYVVRDDPFDIVSLHEPDLDARAKAWLQSRLLEKYQEQMSRSDAFD